MPDLRYEYNAQRIALYRDKNAPPILVQNAESDKRPFIHPILAPDGPGEMTENEPGHHKWQHGLYVGLNKVNGYGFWTEGLTGDASDGTFHPRPLGGIQTANNTATWEVVTDWHAPDGSPLLVESQKWHFADNDDTYTLDVEWSLTASVDLTFGRYDYGGLFLRMPWRKETQGDVRNSESDNTHQTAEGKRARWVALAMPLPGRDNGPAGIAFFDHPTNPGYPNPWRVDGNLGIVPSRCIAGEWHLAQGETSTNRYRLFIYTGGIDRERIEAQWSLFTAT